MLFEAVICPDAAKARSVRTAGLIANYSAGPLPAPLSPETPSRPVLAPDAEGVFDGRHRGHQIGHLDQLDQFGLSIPSGPGRAGWAILSLKTAGLGALWGALQLQEFS